MAFGADHATVTDPTSERQSQYQIRQTGSEGGAQRNGQHQRRKCHPDVEQQRQCTVYPAARIPGDGAKRAAANSADRNRSHADYDRYARPVKQARQHVAAEIVGAEQMRARSGEENRLFESIGQDLRIGIERRQRRSEYCHQDKGHVREQAERSQFVAEEERRQENRMRGSSKLYRTSTRTLKKTRVNAKHNTIPCSRK